MEHTENNLVFDIEANGLLEDATSIHCICGKYLGHTGIFSKFSLHSEHLTRDSILKVFTGANKIICHNQINYDIPMIKKFYDIDLIGLVGIENVVDTYILSQLLYPDRQLPKGCPQVVFNPVTRKSKKIGPHGLESWGYRVGHKKIEIHDWRYFDDAMLDRCETDVLINEKVYYKLLEEAGL